MYSFFLDSSGKNGVMGVNEWARFFIYFIKSKAIDHI